MYARKFAETTPDHPAFIMASTGETVTHREYDERANRLAHLLRDAGLKRGDHYALFMENNNRFLEVCAAGERAGLYYTPVNSYLKADELAYIVQNSESQVLITSRSRRDVAIEAAAQCPARLAVCAPPPRCCSVPSHLSSCTSRVRGCRCAGWVRAPRTALPMRLS